jgi:antitoxin component of MazEF toxin-antitoxin module
MASAPYSKKLTKHGHSLALVIDRGILQLLNIDADTPLRLETDGKALVVTPMRKKLGRKP